MLKSYRQSLLALAVTAMPGVHRMLVVLLIQYRNGLEAVGEFTNDLSIVFLIGLFTTIAWANLILVRVPAADGIERLRVIGQLLRYIVPFGVIGIGVIAILGMLGRASQPVPMMLLLVGWTGYQVIRHYFLSLRNYAILLAADIVSIASMAILILMPGGHLESMTAMAAPLVLFSGSAYVYLTLRLRRSRICTAASDHATLRRGIEYGLTNFLSEGMTLLVTPIAVLISGTDYAGAVGLIGTILGVLLLFPRALSMYYLPALAQAEKQDTTSFFSLYHIFRRRLLATLIAMAILLILVGATVGPVYFREAAALDGAGLIFLLLLANMLIGQLALPDSTRLIVKEQSSATMKVNAIAFCAFTALAFFVTRSEAGFSNLVVLLVGQAVISMLRLGLLGTYAARLPYGKR